MADLRLSRQGNTFTILASQTSTTSNSGTTAVQLPWVRNGLYFLLDVTAQATDVGDTLDVQVQTSLGGTWIDVVAFTQVLGNGTPRKYLSDMVQVNATQAQSNPADTLAADGVRHIIGDKWRVTWDETDADADSSWTFSVIGSIQ